MSCDEPLVSELPDGFCRTCELNLHLALPNTKLRSNSPQPKQKADPNRSACFGCPSQPLFEHSIEMVENPYTTAHYDIF